MNNSSDTPQADFSFVRYANCWEDPQLLIDALKPGPGKRFLSIASAGDNSLSLLAGGAEVVAADLNPAQLACTELRKEAIRQMDHNRFLEFCGVRTSDDRLERYRALRASLTPEAQQYWDAHQEDLASGFIHAGKFEHYFHLFRTRIIPLIHTKKRIHALLSPKSEKERTRFYVEQWDNRRWRLLFRLFFSRRVMGRHGRDPAFFQHVEGTVAERILERTEYALTQLDTSANPYLSYILTGNFTHALPHYLQPEVYAAIRHNIDRLTLRHGAINAIAKEFGPDSFDGFNLSDIFEYLSEEQCETVYAELLRSARPQARFAYWNMLVPRRCPQSLKDRIQPLEDEASRLFKQDRAFFYSRFVLEETK
ncbi:MAG: DUF3419 family protein [Lentisphaerae bacterium]|nr:DUF3419 family protein [Lentisphaerota bacterium]